MKTQSDFRMFFFNDGARRRLSVTVVVNFYPNSLQYCKSVGHFIFH